MAIIPLVRCRDMAASIAFYTQILDFECIEFDGGDPCFAVLIRRGDRIFLSSHSGDGEFGLAMVLPVDDVDALFRELLDRGMKTPEGTASPVHFGPTDQTWGTREFYLDDPDGNTVRFVQGPR
ncbi:MAG: VOC family protein [Candidatus Eisenbacteria bacterium]|nr:VOC family protein [Candidatus Eisenbacteria bacterium]MCC7143312.1 VOC family protein [Candidatus Eisenbacteria bacterium]